MARRFTWCRPHARFAVDLRSASSRLAPPERSTARRSKATDKSVRPTRAESKPQKSKAPPFDFAQGRLSRKGREKWGTREESVRQRIARLNQENESNSPLSA